MTKRDALSIALKVLGVGQVFAWLPQVLFTTWMWHWGNVGGQHMTPGAQRALTAGYIAGMATWLLLALLLIFAGDGIARRLIRHDSPLDISAILSLERPILMLFARLVGLLLLVRAVPMLIIAVAQWGLPVQIWLIKATPHGSEGSVATGLVSLALAAYLLTGARHVVDFILRRSPAEPETQLANGH